MSIDKCMFPGCLTKNVALFNQAILLLVSFFSLGCSSLIAVNVQPQKRSDVQVKLVYELKDIMANQIVFIPESTNIAVNRSAETVLVDYINNTLLQRIPSPDPADFINNIKVSDQNHKLLISTLTRAQVWDIDQMKLINSFITMKNTRISGLSPDGRLLVFGEQVFDVSTKEIIMQVGFDVSPFNLEFSNNMHYLVVDGHHSGASIIDIKSKKQLESLKEKGMQKIQFIQDNLFYAGYGAKLLPELGGYYSASIGLFNIINRKREYEYSPVSRITCWVRLANKGILATLADGNINLLSEKLEVTRSWHLDDKVTTCAAGKVNQVWLGSKSTGIYLLETDGADIRNVIKDVDDVAQMVLSSNKRYLGIVKSIPDGSHINIFSILE